MKHLKLLFLFSVIVILVSCSAGTTNNRIDSRSVTSTDQKTIYSKIYSSQQIKELIALKVLPSDPPQGFVIGFNPNIPSDWQAPLELSNLRYSDGNAMSPKFNLLPKVNTQYKRVSAYLCTKYGLTTKSQCFISNNNFTAVDLQPNFPAEASVVMNTILANEPTLVTGIYHNWMHKADYFPNDQWVYKWYAMPIFEWYPYFAEIDKIWDIEKGKNSISVAILDTGVRRTHSDLNDGRVQTYPVGTNADVIDNDNDPNDEDKYAKGHGTGCAGIVGAIADNGIFGAGIAFNVNIMPVRVLGSDGYGGSDKITAGIELATSLGAHIINMSLGSEGNLPMMDTACKNAWNKGILVLAAGGNSYYYSLDPYDPKYKVYYNPVEYPAAYSSVMAVGAAWPDNWGNGVIDQNWKRCDFSNDHPYIAIATGGTGIPVLQNTDDNAYSTEPVSGTSQACPIVAGVAALLKSFKPDFTNQQIKDIIITKSSALTGFANAPTAGRLDGKKIADFMQTMISFPDVFFQTPEPNKIVPDGKAVSVSLLNSEKLSKVDYYIDGKYVNTYTTAPFFADIGTNKIGNKRTTIEAYCYVEGLQDPKVFTRTIDIVNLIGDTNSDNVVDKNDVNLVILNYGKVPGDSEYRGFYDVNLDGIIDERDLTKIGQFYGRELVLN